MIHLKKILLEQEKSDVEKFKQKMEPGSVSNADNAVAESIQEVQEEDNSIGWLMPTLQAIPAGILGLIIFKHLWVKRKGSIGKSGTATSANKIPLWTFTKGLFSKRIQWVANTKKRQEGIRKTFIEPITRAKKKFTKGTEEYQYLNLLESEVGKALNKTSVMAALEAQLVKHASKEMFQAFLSLNKTVKTKMYKLDEMPELLADMETLLVQLNKEAGETFNKKWAETMILKGIFNKQGAKWPLNYEKIVQPAVQKMIDRVYNVTTKATNPIEKGLEQRARAKEAGLILPGMPGYSSNIRTSGN